MTCQLPLFEMDYPPSDAHDPVAPLREGATRVLSGSGGKETDAMSHYLLNRQAKEGWSDRTIGRTPPPDKSLSSVFRLAA